MGKVAGTRTRVRGMCTLRVRVRVGAKLPTGYLCRTLLEITILFYLSIVEKNDIK